MTLEAIETIEAVDPRTCPSWLQLAREQATASLFVSPPWIRAVAHAYDFSPQAHVLHRAGAPVAGFAWTELDDIRGRRIVSMPFSDWADPFISDERDWTELSIGVPSLPSMLRCRDAVVCEQDPRYEVAGDAAWHATHVDADQDLWAGLKGSARRNVSTAQRSGLTVTVDRSIEAIRSFHALHLRLRKRKYRMLAPPASFFESIWHQFEPAGVATLLVRGTAPEPIAAAVFLRWNDTLYYKFGASDLDALAFRPNDLVFWHGLLLAREVGCTRVDWGVSDRDQPGLIEFKRKWATAEGSVRRIRTVPWPATPNGSLLGSLTELLTRDEVPDHLSAEAGALLYRVFA